MVVYDEGICCCVAVCCLKIMLAALFIYPKRVELYAEHEKFVVSASAGKFPDAGMRIRYSCGGAIGLHRRIVEFVRVSCYQ